MENERDILLFTDEEGNELKMEVLDYFLHDNEEYALLAPVEDDEHDDDCDCGCGELYVMKIVVDGDTEEFIPVEEEKIDELIRTVEALYTEAEEDYYDEFEDDYSFDEEDIY